MIEKFYDQLYASLDKKETHELLEIWQENDRATGSDDAFGVIHEILQNRTGSVPLQDQPVVSEKLPKSNPKRPHFWLGVACLLAAGIRPI